MLRNLNLIVDYVLEEIYNTNIKTHSNVMSQYFDMTITKPQTNRLCHFDDRRNLIILTKKTHSNVMSRFLDMTIVKLQTTQLCHFDDRR
ncbi:hypothetical protein, partial [Algibacter pacificus]|uniref:hypothetical protein n=1 Tax=Algibacter pacificus TaxID=2599389 RepID=UPI001C9CDD25